MYKKTLILIVFVTAVLILVNGCWTSGGGRRAAPCRSTCSINSACGDKYCSFNINHNNPYNPNLRSEYYKPVCMCFADTSNQSQNNGGDNNTGGGYYTGSPIIDSGSKTPTLQERLDKIKAEDERWHQEMVERFEAYEKSLSTGASTITNPPGNQNIGNPHVIRFATPDGVVIPASPRQPNRGGRGQGTGAQRVGGNTDNIRHVTGRTDQSDNPNAGNNIESRAHGAPGSLSYTGGQSNQSQTQQTPTTPQQPTQVKIARLATTTPAPQIPVKTIADFTPTVKPKTEPSPPPVTNPVYINPQQLSGSHWVKEFPDSANISNLQSPFRENVQDFINALEEAGAIVTPTSTLRPKNRALLMYYCWKIVNSGLDPRKVPNIPDVNIIWAHTDINGNYLKEKSEQAAKDMVSAYGIVREPSLTSRHFSGYAIDMNIKWENLTDEKIIYIKNKNGQLVKLDRTNNNKTYNADLNPIIIEVGRTYGVLKFHIPEKDRVHWSDNGR